MAESGIAMKSEGNMFATEKSRILQMRKPVARMIRPPTAVKSAMSAGVVRGTMAPEPTTSNAWMTACGIAMAATA
jgi:hypothetical protein